MVPSVEPSSKPSLLPTPLPSFQPPTLFPTAAAPTLYPSAAVNAPSVNPTVLPSPIPVAAAAAASSGPSNDTAIIAGAVASVLIVGAIVGGFCYYRSTKDNRSPFDKWNDVYDKKMQNNKHESVERGGGGEFFDVYGNSTYTASGAGASFAAGGGRDQDPEIGRTSDFSTANPAFGTVKRASVVTGGKKPTSPIDTGGASNSRPESTQFAFDTVYNNSNIDDEIAQPPPPIDVASTPAGAASPSSKSNVSNKRVSALAMHNEALRRSSLQGMGHSGGAATTSNSNTASSPPALGGNAVGIRDRPPKAHEFTSNPMQAALQARRASAINSAAVASAAASAATAAASSSKGPPPPPTAAFSSSSPQRSNATSPTRSPPPPPPPSAAVMTSPGSSSKSTVPPKQPKNSSGAVGDRDL